MSIPVTLLLGPARHGVVRYARELAAAGGFATATRMPGAAACVHVHVTDRALAETPARAAAVIEELAAAVPVSVTLHDVPQESDGRRNLALRSAAYRRIASAAAAVAVSSAHEARLAAEHLDLGPHVIPLGIRHAIAPSVDPAPSAAVLIAGYVYPGKGHEEAVLAAAEVGRRTGTAGWVRALGGVSDGHAEEAARLHRIALEHGVRFEITGFLSDSQYVEQLRGPGVPLVAHRHVSASRSLLDWIEQGRRPLVSRSGYAHETERLRPGTMTLVSGLADALEAAAREPRATVLAPGTPLGPTLADAADAYRRWWSTEVAW